MVNVEIVTLQSIVEYLGQKGYPYDILPHRQPTITVDQKRMLLEAYPSDYKGWFPVSILQGSLLCSSNQGKVSVIAYFHDGSSRISFNKLKRAIKIPKKRDLHFCKGNLAKLIASPVEEGAVSIVNTLTPQLDGAYFDTALFDSQVAYDIAITRTSSLFAYFNHVYEALLASEFRDRLHIV